MYAKVPNATYATNTTAAAPITVTFTSAVPSVATITPSATWATGSGTSGYATLTGVSSGSTSITASAPGFLPVTSDPITVTP